LFMHRTRENVMLYFVAGDDDDDDDATAGDCAVKQTLKIGYKSQAQRHQEVSQQPNLEVREHLYKDY